MLLSGRRPLPQMVLEEATMSSEEAVLTQLPTADSSENDSCGYENIRPR